MKKLIIFDMDGVLVDSIQIAKNALNLSYSGFTDEIHKKIQSGNFHEEIKKYDYLKNPETEEERKLRHIQYAEIKSNAPLYEGIKDLLERLCTLQYILVLNTSAYERNCLPLLEKTGIKNYFNFIATAEVSKNKVEKFKLIENKYNTKSADLLFITDTLGDVKEAQIANIPTVAVTWGGHDRSFFDCEQYSNLVGIVDSVSELDNFIQAH